MPSCTGARSLGWGPDAPLPPGLPPASVLAAPHGRECSTHGCCCRLPSSCRSPTGGVTVPSPDAYDVTSVMAAITENPKSEIAVWALVVPSGGSGGLRSMPVPSRLGAAGDPWPPCPVNTSLQSVPLSPRGCSCLRVSLPRCPSWCQDTGHAGVRARSGPAWRHVHTVTPDLLPDTVTVTRSRRTWIWGKIVQSGVSALLSFTPWALRLNHSQSEGRVEK